MVPVRGSPSIIVMSSPVMSLSVISMGSAAERSVVVFVSVEVV